MNEITPRRATFSQPQRAFQSFSQSEYYVYVYGQPQAPAAVCFVQLDRFDWLMNRAARAVNKRGKE